MRLLRLVSSDRRGAALGAFLLGYSIDIVSSRIMVSMPLPCHLVFLAVCLELARDLAAKSAGKRRSSCCSASLVKGAWLWCWLSAVFVSIEGFLDRRGLVYNQGSSHRLALLAPVVFRALTTRRELHQANFARRLNNRGRCWHLAISTSKTARTELRRRVASALRHSDSCAFWHSSARLVFLQIIQGERYTFLSENNRIRIKRVPGTRGMVSTAEADLLIDSRPSFDLTLRCRRIAKRRRIRLRLLARYWRDESELLKTFQDE